ncbi:MAG: cache domain-containing protein, partial [Alphaproteobacteria bacterium]
MHNRTNAQDPNTSSKTAERAGFAILPKRLSTKAPLAMIGCLALLATVIGVTSTIVVEDALVGHETAQLQATAHSRAAEVDAYLESIGQDMRILANDPQVARAIASLSNAFSGYGDKARQELQRQYIVENPHPVGEKDKLDAAQEQSFYNDFHASFHPVFRNFLRERAYYDIFLINPKGDVVYTVFKEADYATNLMTGQWRDTGLARMFRSAIDIGVKGGLTFSDFEAYAPSNGAPASFVAIPVVSGGEVVGVLAAQMPVDRIASVLDRDSDLGAMGEIYLVGSDGLLRSDSRFTSDLDILKTRVDLPSLDQVMAGEEIVGSATDVSGEPLVVAMSPIDALGAPWAVVARMSEGEIMAPVRDLRNTIIGIAAACVVVIGALAVLVSRKVTRRVALLTSTVQSLANGANG